MTNCETCEHSVFDKVWGELKCKAQQRRVYDPSSVVECPDYKEKEKGS